MSTDGDGTDGGVGASAVPAENVNIDAIVLDDPSWYLIAAAETPDPTTWLAYAQDRKLEDPRYTVAAFRRDIRRARRTEGLARGGRGRSDEDADDPDEPALQSRWNCPWVKPYCTRSGRPVPVATCTACPGTACATATAPIMEETPA